MKVVHKNARPFFFKGGKIGCLLIHGFTGSPSETRLMGEYLAQKGFTVSGILLAGHGTTPEDMLKTNQYMWYNSVVEGFNKLKTKCSHIYLVGLSMGGLLALQGACGLPVQGIVVMSTPIFLADRRISLLPILKRFTKFHHNDLLGKAEEKKGLLLKQLKGKHSDIKDQNDHENDENSNYDKRFAYDRIPLKCLDYLLELIMKIKSELINIKVPVLIIQSHQDRVVQPKSAAFIFDHLGSEDKELYWLYKSNHVITLGQERELVFQKIYGFIDGRENSIN